MKKLYYAILSSFFCSGISAASFTVTIVGSTYSPAALTVTIGDVITIQASATHPLVQVSNADWSAQATTSLVGGWGVKTADYTFTISTANSIYFLCQNHGPFGMKGRIDIGSVGLNENNFINNFNLFPNPATDKLILDFVTVSTSQINVKLFNMLGQESSVLLKDSQVSVGNNHINFDLPVTLANGTYFVVISSNERRTVKKIVVNK